VLASITKKGEIEREIRSNLFHMMKEKIKKISHLKRRTMIKGEMPMFKTRKMNKIKGRHTQESTKQSNEITP
jgi:hypothetical protein